MFKCKSGEVIELNDVVNYTGLGIGMEGRGGPRRKTAIAPNLKLNKVKAYVTGEHERLDAPGGPHGH